MAWNLPPGCTDKDIDDAAPQNEPEYEYEDRLNPSPPIPGEPVQCDECQRMFDPDEDGCFIGWHRSFGDCCQCARCVDEARGQGKVSIEECYSCGEYRPMTFSKNYRIWTDAGEKYEGFFCNDCISNKRRDG